MKKIALALFLVSYGFSQDNRDRTYITYYEGTRQYTGTGVPDDRGPMMAVGAVVGLVGLAGWMTGFQMHKRALVRLDRDMRRYYRID